MQNNSGKSQEKNQACTDSYRFFIQLFIRYGAGSAHIKNSDHFMCLNVDDFMLLS